MSRRATIAGAGLLAGCEHTWPDLPLPADGVLRRRISDAHVHLFNVADLPARGFIRHVFVRKEFPDMPEAGAALVDFIARVLKHYAMTASDELDALDKKQRTREHTPERFGEFAVEAMATRAQGAMVAVNAAESVTAEDLATGYDQLAFILGLRYEPTPAGIGPFVDPTLASRREGARQDLFAEAAREAYRADENIEETLRLNIMSLDRQRQLDGVQLFSVAALRERADGFAKIINTIKWGYVMLQPRSVHLDRYVRIYGGPGSQPFTIVNLLVDYDKWLRDQPSDGSEHAKQAEFWARARTHYSSAVDIRTFASFCPLKQAITALRPGTKHLDDLKNYRTRWGIAGIKLYPPMGFQASGNRDLSFEAEKGPDGKYENNSIGNQVTTDWRTACGSLPDPGLGASIDKALNDLYAWCAEGEGIPILAHSGGSMTPAKNFEPRPHPKHWRAPLTAHPNLRVTFGHFAQEADKFTFAMEGACPPTNIWPLEDAGIPSLFRDFPNVFTDLAYTDELLGADAEAAQLPKRFFLALKKYCTEGYGDISAVDPNFDRFLYGSDWIMLGHEGAHPTYLRMMRDAMRAAEWDTAHIEKVCETNAKRWLGTPSR